SKADRALGCFSEPLDFPLGDSLMPALAALRSCWSAPGRSLPRLIGRDGRDESTSALALRTLTQALLVALATLSTLSLPLAKLVAPARVPILAVSGLSARGLVQRAAVLLGFVGAAFYITARLLTAAPGATAPFGAIWDRAVLLSWV